MNPRHARTAVVALGGNAITAEDQRGTEAEILENCRQMAASVVRLIDAGWRVVLTHGNGPQVGNLLVKNELAAAVVPPVPLDWCGAQTQGTIGTLLLDALDVALAARGSLGSGRRAAGSAEACGSDEGTEPIAADVVDAPPTAHVIVRVDHAALLRGSRRGR